MQRPRNTRHRRLHDLESSGQKADLLARLTGTHDVAVTADERKISLKTMDRVGRSISMGSSSTGFSRSV